MCQEIGHTWGLDHQDESGADFHTCMDYATNPDSDNTHPNRHDYEELALIYSHVDATTTIGRLAAHSARVLRVDRKGRSVVERRFADGSRQVTFIIWRGSGRQRLRGAGSAGPFAYLLVFMPPGCLGTIRASGPSKVEMRHSAPVRSSRLSAAAVLLLVAVMGCDGASKVTQRRSG
jgi:hypothetical protein